MLAAAFLSAIALLPGVLTDTVTEVKQQTPLPILLPDNFYSDFDPVYPSGTGSKQEYSIGLAGAPDCGGWVGLGHRWAPLRNGDGRGGRGRVGDTVHGGSASGRGLSTGPAPRSAAQWMQGPVSVVDRRPIPGRILVHTASGASAYPTSGLVRASA